VWYSPPFSLFVYSVFFSLFILRNSSKHHLHQTHVERCTDWHHKFRNTQVHDDRQSLCVCVCVCVRGLARWRNCLCSVLMSFRVGHIYCCHVVLGSELSISYTLWSVRLSHRLWNLAGRHVDRSGPGYTWYSVVSALFAKSLRLRGNADSCNFRFGNICKYRTTRLASMWGYTCLKVTYRIKI